MELALYPFTVVKKYAPALFIPLIAIIFLIGASMYGSGNTEFADIQSIVDHQFGSNVSFAASDLTQYDKIGANGLIPIIRLGGITKALDAEGIQTAVVSLQHGIISPELVSFLIIFITLFLAYITYAMVSNVVFSLKNNKDPKFGIGGLNRVTVAISFCAALVVIFISSFSMVGFELVLLLNFGIFFTLAIPGAAAGQKFGESFFDAFDFFRFNLKKLVVMYLLCMGVAISAQIGLLIVFMFPLSVIDPSVVPAMKTVLSLFGIVFALFFQYVVCSRAVYDFSRKTAVTMPAMMKIAKKIK